MLQLEVEAQKALREAADNFPSPVGALGGWLMSFGISPLGELMRPYKPPRDTLTKEVANLLSTPSAVHSMFAEGLYLDEGGVAGENRMARLINAMPVCLQADELLAACKREKREITAEEASLVARADASRNELVQVDVHMELGPAASLEGSVRPALASTDRRMLLSVAASFEQAHAAADGKQSASSTA